MEKFNVSEFESHKQAGEYRQVRDDGTIVLQFGDAGGYFEKIIPPDGWFFTYKEFYGNGNLKVKGAAFKKGDFQSGVWIEADEKGHLVKEINYDSAYIASIDDIFKILKHLKIPFSIDNKFNAIKRYIENSKSRWLVEWKMTEGKIERIIIDDASGKIIKQDNYRLEEDH